MKRCPRCGKTKPASEYHKNARMRDGLHVYCKPCWNGYCKQRWDNDQARPDRLRVRRNWHLKAKFGITVDQYDAMLQAQGGVCACCGGSAEAGGGQVGALGPIFRVDHDHKCCPGKTTCGKCIRALLCDRCNKGVGVVERVGLSKITAYLARV